MFLTISIVALSLVSAVPPGSTMTTPHSSTNVDMDYCVPATKLWRSRMESVPHLLEKDTSTILVGTNVDMDCCTDIYLYSFSFPPASVCVG